MIKGTGITTRQIISAPKDSIYVCHNAAIPYAKDLIRRNNRTDLKLMSLSHTHMRFDSDCLRGLRKFIILDHAINIHEIHPEVFDYIEFHNHQMEKILK